MDRRIVGWLCAVGCFLAAAGGSWAHEGVYVNRLKAPQVAQAPVIDADLGDAAWLTAALAGAKASGFVTHDGGAVTRSQPVAFVVWDRDNLYVAFRVFHYATDELVTPGRADGDAVWEGDDVEIFIDTRHDHATHYQLTVGANNVKTLPTHPTRDISGIRTATAHDALSWTAEIAIPWSVLDVTPEVGMVMGFNLNGRSIRPVDQWMAWSPTFGAFANPSRFGHLELGPPYR